MIPDGHRAHFDRETLMFTPRAWGSLSAEQQARVLQTLEWVATGLWLVPRFGGWNAGKQERMQSVLGRLRATVLGCVVNEADYWDERWWHEDQQYLAGDPNEGVPRR